MQVLMLFIVHNMTYRIHAGFLELSQGCVACDHCFSRQLGTLAQLAKSNLILGPDDDDCCESREQRAEMAPIFCLLFSR